MNDRSEFLHVNLHYLSNSHIVCKMLKQVIQQGRRRVNAGGVPTVHPPNPEPPRRALSQRYVEDFDELRTQLGTCFSILAGRL
jgi:hypothetical protein